MERERRTDRQLRHLNPLAHFVTKDLLPRAPQSYEANVRAAAIDLIGQRIAF